MAAEWASRGLTRKLAPGLPCWQAACVMLEFRVGCGAVGIEQALQ